LADSLAGDGEALAYFFQDVLTAVFEAKAPLALFVLAGLTASP